MRETPFWHNSKRSVANKTAGVSFKDTPFQELSEKLIYILLGSSLLLFILWPILLVLKESLHGNSGLSLGCYYQLFSQNRRLISDSFLLAVASSALSVTLGLVMALYLTYSHWKGKLFIYAVLLLSMISPPFIAALSYVMLFGRRGFITYKLLHLSINPYGWHGVLIMQVLGFASIAALLIMGVLSSRDQSLEQASMDLGATPLQTLLRVILPVAKPGIIVAFLLVFVQVLADFGTPIIIGGNFSVLASEAYLQVIGLYDLPKASAMSTLLLIPSLLMFLIYRRMMNRSHFSSPSVGSSSNELMRLSPFTNLFLGVLTLSFVGFELLKYLTIFWGAFARTWGVNFSFTLNHIVDTLGAGKMDSFWRSLEYSLIAAIICSFMGMLLSYYLERKKYWGHSFFDFVATLPFMIPGPFLGIAYLLAFHGPPIDMTGTALIVICNCMFRQIPVSTRAGAAVLTQISPDIELSAKDLGARDLRVFFDIILPQLKPAFLVSFINTFTATMTTVGAIIFLISPGSKLATVELFEFVKIGKIGEAAVFANLIILATLIINLMFSFIIMKRKLRNQYLGGEGVYVSGIARAN